MNRPIPADRTAPPDAGPQRARVRRPTSRWAAPALPVAATWSVTYLVLGIAWLAGAGGNPADPEVDDSPGLSLLTGWGPQAGAAILTALAGLGVVLAGVMTVLRRVPHPVAALRRLSTALAAGLGLVLAVVLPDYRLLASIAYTPILLVLTLIGAAPANVTLWPWPVVNMAVLSIAGLAWVTAAVVGHRGTRGGVCASDGSGRMAWWATPEAAARWGRWATGLAVVVPLGYAATRFAWALGIPLGVRQQLLDDLGDGVYAGAALGTLAVGGAVLTLGLVQRWGARFPRWTLGLRGRPVPVGLAVVPAAAVSVVITSAGLMFVRFGLTGGFAASFPGENRDVAAWLPEMFWPLWGVALAAATYAYWLRRHSDAPHAVARHTSAGTPPGGGDGA